MQTGVWNNHRMTKQTLTNFGHSQAFIIATLTHQCSFLSTDWWLSVYSMSMFFVQYTSTFTYIYQKFIGNCNVTDVCRHVGVLKELARMYVQVQYKLK